MTSEPYVPPKIGFVRAEMHLGDGAWKKLTETEFDHFIAKIKADALREAAEAWRKHLLTTDASYVCAESWLNVRAGRIGEEA